MSNPPFSLQLMRGSLRMALGSQGPQLECQHQRVSNPRAFTKATFTNPNNALFRKNPQNDHRCLSLIPQIWAIFKWPGFTDPMNLTAISLLAVLCWGNLLLGPWFFAKNQVSVCPNLCPNLKSFSFKTKKSDTTRLHMWGLNSCLPMDPG